MSLEALVQKVGLHPSSPVGIGHAGEVVGVQVRGRRRWRGACTSGGGELGIPESVDVVGPQVQGSCRVTEIVANQTLLAWKLKTKAFS